MGNIQIIDDKVLISESLFKKMKVFFKNEAYCGYTDYSDVTEMEISFSLFNDMVATMLEKLKYYSDVDSELTVPRLSSLRTNDNEKKLIKIENFIEEAYKKSEEIRNYNLLRDLASAKKDCTMDMKYFMTQEEIKAFEIEYDVAIQEENISKMFDMVRTVNQMILDEWKKYVNNMDSMTDNNFRFIGHSVHNADFTGEFNSGVVSCSLFNQDVNDTYMKKFGFILPPDNIIAANNRDMYINNKADDPDLILSYSSVPKINHPQRIIDECSLKKKNSSSTNEKVYSEVVISKFQPIGIFCFTNGLKEFEPDYVMAKKLHDRFPDLPFYVFDVMKNKKDDELRKAQIGLIRQLNVELSLSLEINDSDIEKYGPFLKKYDELKKKDDYTKEDIIAIFKHNVELLSPLLYPDQLFGGKYTHEEIKFVLGKNSNYYIDAILKGNILGAFNFTNLCERLKGFAGKLNEYYDGLDEFVIFASRVNINDNNIEELKKKKFSNFRLIYEYLKKEKEKSENYFYVDENHSNAIYEALLKEKREREELEGQYRTYNHIYINSAFASLIKKDYYDTTDALEKESKDIVALELEKENLIKKSERIEQFRSERKLLTKHPVLNIRKIKKLDNEIRKFSLNFNVVIKKVSEFLDQIALTLEYDLETTNRKLKKFQSLKSQHTLMLNQLKSKIFELFKCDSVELIDKAIEEAEQFMKNYDKLNSYRLSIVNEKLERDYLNQNMSLPVAKK